MPIQHPTNPVVDRINTRIAEMATAPPEAPAATAEAAPELAISPTPPDGSEAASASAASDGGSSPPPPDASAAEAPTTAPPEQKTKHQLLEEKLAAVRERRAAQRRDSEARAALTEKQRRAAAEAEADRKAAADERARWEGARKDYRSAFRELGLDARQVYDEMTRQAVEEGKPETQLARMQDAWKAEMASMKEEITQLRKERAESEQRARDSAVQQHFQADFHREVQDQAFAKLRVEYDDSEILGYADALRRQPERLVQTARAHGIRLTDPSRGFTMREILTVLAAAQDAHDTKREQRRAKLQAAPSPAAAGTKPPTVNGTSAPKAGTTVGNDLASARAASGGGRRISRSERIEMEIRKLEGT